MSELTGKKTKAVPKQEKEIGIDTKGSLIDTVLDAVEVGDLNTTVLDSFTSATQTRQQIYGLIDTMSEDDRVSSVLETYAEDATATNDNGQIIWCESSDKDVNSYITYLLDSLNVDKHAYEWTYNLCKYGDIYLKLFRESDYNDDPIFGNKDKERNKDKTLNEDILVKIDKQDDNYVHFVEMVPNSAEMFELTKYGKTMGFIQAPTAILETANTETTGFNYINYEFKKKDVTIFDATDFVHGCLTNTNFSRTPEEVNILITDENDESIVKSTSTYKIKKGQSLLYNDFKIWRELSLLENSVLLNRVVKSALIRVINVEVGNMPKEQVRNYLSRLKQQIEQKTALNTNNSINEYNNSGPVSNSIFVPTNEGKGAVTMTAIGGDFDPKQLTDLDYFLNKFYGGLRVPKQFFSNTDDSAGFNGGSSLAIISSRYGKAIKRIQNTICQLVTDLINLFLVNKGLTNYINKFTIKMQAPVTQEELDRREDMRNRMGVINDIISQTNNVVTDDVLKLKIVKSLLSTAVADPEVITLLQEQIDMLEKKQEKTPDEDKKDKPEESSEETSHRPSKPSPISPTAEEPKFEFSSEEETIAEPEPESEAEEPSYLPSPDELQLDLTQNTEI